jgi:DNA-binding XRE family transcriptional regulator
MEKIVSSFRDLLQKIPHNSPLRKSLLYYNGQDVKQADLVEILGLSKATISQAMKEKDTFIVHLFSCTCSKYLISFNISIQAEITNRISFFIKDS